MLIWQDKGDALLMGKPPIKLFSGCDGIDEMCRTYIGLLCIVGVCNLMSKLLSNGSKEPWAGGGTYAQHAPGVVLVISETAYADMTSIVM